MFPSLKLSRLTLPEPPLTPAERAIIKPYGGWSHFLASYGLNPADDDDAEEGLSILKGLVACAQ